MKVVFWGAKMLYLYVGLIFKFETVKRKAASTYNGHLSTFSRGVLLIPEALSHNFVKGEPSPK